MKKKIYIAVAAVLLVATVGAIAISVLLKNKEEICKTGYYIVNKPGELLGKKIGANDIWEYEEKEIEYEGGNNVIYSTSTCDTSSVTSTKSNVSYGRNTSSESYVGYSVGGANNIKNFRENINNGYLPLSTDITYNGLFSEYYFDPGKVDRDSHELFYPSYSVAVSTNPITGEKEYYMSVGLNSNIKQEDFKRKKLNLVIVLDISGSMSSGFSSYYYDKKDNIGEKKTKMKIAEECVNGLIDKLNPDDRIGIVLFDDKAYRGCKITQIGDTDTEILKEHILEVNPMGGTNFSAGYEMGTELFNDKLLLDEEYENRIIVVTDAMPNLGITSQDGMTEKIKKNSNNNIYTTFIGVGVDFNTKYTEGVSDVRGFNYYSVHSTEEFKKILVDEFDYMVTPLVFDLDLSFKSDYYEIENVYGSDSVNKQSGNIMHVNTLFPSSSNDDGDVKGGIIVLKLKKIKEADNAEISLNVSYKDTEEKAYNNSKKVTFKDSNEDYYDNNGIRKAVVLSRYVGTMKNWTIYEKTQDEEFDARKENHITEYCHDDDYVKTVLGVNERSSIKLNVSENYKETFKELKKYMENENKVLNDDDMKKEIELLDKLSK